MRRNNTLAQASWTREKLKSDAAVGGLLCRFHICVVNATVGGEIAL